MQLSIGKASGELLLNLRHLRQADGINRSDAHRAFDHAGELFQFDLKFFLAPRHIAAQAVEKLAGRCEGKGARAAVEQRNAEAALHLLHLLAGGRLADPAGRSGPAYAAQLSDVPKQPNVWK